MLVTHACMLAGYSRQEHMHARCSRQVARPRSTYVASYRSADIDRWSYLFLHNKITDNTRRISRQISQVIFAHRYTSSRFCGREGDSLRESGHINRDTGSSERKH
jgi:hypothetical protein